MPSLSPAGIACQYHKIGGKDRTGGGSKTGPIPPLDSLTFWTGSEPVRSTTMTTHYPTWQSQHSTRNTTTLRSSHKPWWAIGRLREVRGAYNLIPLWVADAAV
ncbi:hypothetical protein FKM82_005455 [Ascaphus truei]